MTTIELKNLAHAKMVEAMTLLKAAYEMADMEAVNAEAKARGVANVLARFDYVHSIYEGNPIFEAGFDTVINAYDKAEHIADLLRYDADQIDGSMMSLRDAMDAIEETWSLDIIED